MQRDGNSVGAGLVAGGGLTALLLWAGFAPLEWWWAGVAGLVPLWGAGRRLGARGTGAEARVAYWSFAMFWLGSLWWLTRVTVCGWVGLSCWCAMFGLPATLFVWRWKGGVLGGAAGAALLWAGGEAWRGWIGGGFAWNPLAASLAGWLPAVQTASVGGASLAGALGAWTAAGAALAMGGGRAGRWREWAVWAAVPAAALVWGAWRAGAVEREEAGWGSVRVAVVQPAIPQDEKWAESRMEMIYGRLETLTREAAEAGAELVVWPETALPEDLRWSKRAYGLTTNLLAEAGGAWLLAGSLDRELASSGAGTGVAPEVLYYNAAFLLHPAGGMAEYRKRHLVLMGEYVPLSRWFPQAWRDALGVPLDITAGTQAGIFTLPVEGGKGKLGAVEICFEDTVSALARRDVGAGAEILFNLTNDAWFDDSDAPRQHLCAGILRAVETGRPLVQCANTGVSAWIGPSGRVRGMFRDAEGRTCGAGTAAWDVKVPDAGRRLTIHGRMGYVFEWLAAAAVPAAWIWPRVRAWRDGRRKKKPC